MSSEVAIASELEWLQGTASKRVRTSLGRRPQQPEAVVSLSTLDLER